MAARSLRAAAWAACAAAGIAAVVALGGGSATPARAQPTPSLMAPPACTCSAPTVLDAQQVHNCQCGALQCVIVGRAAVAPALVCQK